MADLKDITLKDLTPDALKLAGKKNIPEQADVILSYILYKLNATDSSRTKSTSEVVNEYDKLRNEEKSIVKLTKDTIATYLSILAKQDYSLITCPGRKQGYYLSSVVTQQNPTVNSSQSASRANKLLEKKLYPYLEDWMKSEGYAVKTGVASRHKMKNPWQNPDILGIKIIDTLGETKVEVATIEAKKDTSNWHQDIFEAVAHKVLSNRVYFAFCRKASQKDDKEMIEYAMFYRIGLLAIVMPDEDWENALGSKDFNFSDVEIQIIVPAPYQETLQLPYSRLKFLNNFDIKTKEDYWRLFTENNKN